MWFSPVCRKRSTMERGRPAPWWNTPCAKSELRWVEASHFSINCKATYSTTLLSELLGTNANSSDNRCNRMIKSNSENVQFGNNSTGSDNPEARIIGIRIIWGYTIQMYCCGILYFWVYFKFEFNTRERHYEFHIVDNKRYNCTKRSELTLQRGSDLHIFLSWIQCCESYKSFIIPV